MALTLGDIADPATFWNNLITNEHQELVRGYLYQILHDFTHRTRICAAEFTRRPDLNRKLEWSWIFNPKDEIQKSASEAFVSRLINQKWDTKIVAGVNQYSDSKIVVYLDPAQGEFVP